MQLTHEWLEGLWIARQVYFSGPPIALAVVISSIFSYRVLLFSAPPYQQTLNLLTPNGQRPQRRKCRQRLSQSFSDNAAEREGLDDAITVIGPALYTWCLSTVAFIVTSKSHPVVLKFKFKNMYKLPDLVFQLAIVNSFKNT